jgi:hypothetical protein
MPSNYNLQYIKGSKATTSGTYAEDEIEMPVAKGSLLPAIVEIQVQFPQMQDKANLYAECHISTKSEDDIQDLDDEDIIFFHRRESSANAAPVGFEDTVVVFRPAAPIPISAKKLYFGFKSDDGTNHTYRYRIGIVPRYVKGVVQKQSMNTIEF